MAGRNDAALFAGMPGVKGLAMYLPHLRCKRWARRGAAGFRIALRAGLLLTGAPVGTLYAFGGALTSLL
ncbi:MAG: hypothetical protein ACLT0Y_06725 [Christensenellales bacterium]